MSVSTGGGLIIQERNKPEQFDGKRDFLMVNTWIYKSKQFLAIIQLNNKGAVLSHRIKITYASTFLSGTAALCWYINVLGYMVPLPWVDFKAVGSSELIQPDHVRPAREKICRLKHGF